MASMEAKVCLLTPMEAVATLGLIEVYLERCGADMRRDLPAGYQGLVGVQDKLRALLCRCQSDQLRERV